MTSGPRDIRRRELGGPDPLDRRLGVPPAPTLPSPLAWLLSLLMTRSALGLAPSLTPAAIFLPVGALLGPRGLGLLSPLVLARLDVVVTIALAVLGVLVGVGLGREITARRLFVAASLESAVTIIAVTGATMYFVMETGVPVGAPVAAFGLAFGLCASASSATSADPDSEAAASVATNVADLDDVLPIVIATVAFAVLPGPSSVGWTLALAPIAIGVVVGLIGWLLFDRAESGAERVVFVLGTLALAGGAAVYLQRVTAGGRSRRRRLLGDRARPRRSHRSRRSPARAASADRAPAPHRRCAVGAERGVRSGCLRRTCCSGWSARSPARG